MIALAQWQDTVNQALHGMRVQLGELSSRTGGTPADIDTLKRAVSELAAKASATQASTWSVKTGALVTLKETTVDKLPDGVTKADFDNWVEEFFVHIDRVDGWRGMSSLLKEVRLCKQDITDQLMDDMVEKVHNADNEFNKITFDMKARDKDLYAYLLRKLNKKLKALVASTRSGFEVFRRIMREEAPVTESTEYSLRFAFQQMVFQKSGCMDDTRKLISILEKKIVDYREKTGKELDEVLKTTVLHGAIDAETAREVRRSEVELTYEKMKAFIE